MRMYLAIAAMLVCGGCATGPAKVTVARGFYPDAPDHNGTVVSVSVTLERGE